MISPVRTFGLVAGLLVASTVAGPVAARDVEVVPALQKRDIQLGSFSLATSYENDVLFKIGAGASDSSSDGTVKEAFSLEVECLDCRTWGTAVVSTAGVTKDESILGDIISFFKHPLDVIADAFHLDVRVDFENVGGHFEFEIFAADTVSYSFPIFESESPVGIACSEDVSLGLVLFIDLVFSLTAEIDLEAGFDFSFPDGAYITVDPLSGDIVDQGFTGGQLNQLPVTVTSGSATFKAALRIRVQAGTTVEVFGTGFDFELGVYADLIEYVATIGTSPACELYITESVDCNVGAFAHAVAEIDYKTWGASPAVVTTLIDIPLPSLCVTRPVDTTLPALPTVTGSVITSGAAATSSGSVAVSTTAASSASASSASASSASASSAAVSSVTVSSATSSIATSTGGIFAQGSTTLSFPSVSASLYASTSASASATSPSYPLNGTITSAASLTTSTVISTTLITITSCSSTVLHCPASLTSEIVITSTTILYTTVCPAGQVQPTFTLATSVATSAVVTYPASTATATITASPISLTPCATPVISTVYTPTFTTPTYAVPTQTTTFTVLNPGYSASSAAGLPTSAAGGVVGVASTITVAPVYSATGAPYPPVSTVKPAGSAGNSTISGSTSLPSSTVVPFTAGASRSSGSVMVGLVVALIGSFALL